MSDTHTSCLIDVTNKPTVIDINEKTNTLEVEPPDLSLSIQNDNSNNHIKTIPTKMEDLNNQTISFSSPSSSSSTTTTSTASSPSSESSTQSLTCHMERTHIHSTPLQCETLTPLELENNNNNDNNDNDKGSNNKKRTWTRVDNCWCRYCGCIDSCRWRTSPFGSKSACNKCFFRHQNYSKGIRTTKWDLDWNTNYYPERPLEDVKNEEKVRITTINNNYEGNNHLQKRYKSLSSSSSPSSSQSLNKKKELMSGNLETNKQNEKSSSSALPKKKKMCSLSKSTLRGNKSFLKAGLYSGDTNNVKDDDDSEKKIFKFKLPIHHGQWILEHEEEFTLPLDIIEDYEHDRLFLPSPSSTNKPPRFTRIQQNAFIERKPRKADQPSICQCNKPVDDSLGCGEDCLNRMMFIECDPDTCPCEKQCSNQQFRKREFIKELEIFLTDGKGWGLRTLIPIKQGSLIIEYCGEIISEKTCQQRIQTIYRRQKNHYFLDYQRGEVIDACTKGSEARFINHGCDPNCHIEKWNRGGEYHLGVFASKDIEANTELFYDYNFSLFDTESIGQECFCGSEKCRGYLGRKHKKG